MDYFTEYSLLFEINIMTVSYFLLRRNTTNFIFEFNDHILKEFLVVFFGSMEHLNIWNYDVATKRKIVRRFPSRSTESESELWSRVHF